MSRIKTFLKNLIVYFFGKVLTFLVSVLLLSLFTNYVSTTDYGNYELVRSILDLFIPFVCLECWKGIFRLSFSEKYSNNKQTLFSTSIFLTLISSTIIAAGFSIYCYYNKLSFIGLFLIFSESMCFLFQYIARSLNKNFAFSLSGIISALVNAGVGFLCIFIFKYSKDAMMIALVSSQFIQFIFLLLATKGWRFFNFHYFSFRTFLDIFKFSWPFSLTTLVYFFSDGFNKIFIESILGSENLAIYVVALKFITIVAMIASVVEMAWSDLLFSIKDDKERKLVTVNWTNAAFKFFCILSVSFLLLIQLFFPLLIGEEYLKSYELIPYLYISTFFVMANDVLLNPCRAENKPWINLICKTIKGIACVVLLLTLTPYIGIIGACIAYSASFIVEFICFLILNKKILKISINFTPSFIFVILYIPVALSVTYSEIFVTASLTFLVLIFGFFYMQDFIRLILKKINKEEKFNCKIDFLLSNRKKIIVETILFQAELWLIFVATCVHILYLQILFYCLSVFGSIIIVYMFSLRKNNYFLISSRFNSIYLPLFNLVLFSVVSGCIGKLFSTLTLFTSGTGLFIIVLSIFMFVYELPFIFKARAGRE